MNTDILISVVVPVYNTKDYLVDCFDSVFLNHRQDIELIIIDDGSTDGSTQKCEDYAQKNLDRVTLVVQKNSGVSVARNKGINMAKGKYLVFLDSDDKLMPNALDNVDFSDNCDLYVFNYKSEDYLSNCIRMDHIERIDNPIPYCEKALYPYREVPSIQNANYSTPWTKIYKTKIIKDNSISFPIEVKMGEDMLFNVEYLLHAKTVKFYNLEFYCQELNRLDSAVHREKSEAEQLNNDLNFCSASWKLFSRYKLSSSYDNLFCDSIIIYFANDWLHYGRSLIGVDKVRYALKHCSKSKDVVKKKILVKILLSKHNLFKKDILRVARKIGG